MFCRQWVYWRLFAEEVLRALPFADASSPPATITDLLGSPCSLEVFDGTSDLRARRRLLA